MWNSPQLSEEMTNQYSPEELAKGMQTEMNSMDYFDVYVERNLSTLTEAQRQGIIKSKWVLRRKEDGVRCRLVGKGFAQEINDKDADAYASTPQLVTLKCLLAFALARQQTILSGDVSTAFLHATLPDDQEIFIEPPQEYYGGTNIVWKLKRPLYGLRTAPKAWQDHFADTMLELGGTRLKCENNVYVFTSNDGNKANNTTL